MTEHVYRAALAWSGSTGVGYDDYSRGHRIDFPGVPGALDLSSDPLFRGDASRANPEHLLLAAAASCQLLSFLAVAARARIDVVDYRDSPEAVMPLDAAPIAISRVVLRPEITVRGAGAERVPHLAQVAHRECFIANSLACAIEVLPTVREA